ncbi:GFA family protein [Dyella solisilvae]|uniref:GFA family protein n=1 Tax=Dyella solisilvae TaxID=1920168 RepID=A0A370KDU9_9GAMM|nr:GFA family protein [Dyella solisilvae]RDJ00722.1 GFA family protein [Dyella solisilvae]
MTQRVATCSCRQLMLRATEEPLRVSICHCHACQRRTGSAFGVQARFREESVVIRGAATAYVRSGDSGGRATFHFCPVCGTTVYYQLEEAKGLVGVPVGAFTRQDLPPPSISVFEECMQAWVRLPDDIEHVY